MPFLTSLVSSRWTYFIGLGAAAAFAGWLAFHEYGVAQAAGAKATAQCYAQESKSNATIVSKLKIVYTARLAQEKALYQRAFF